MNFGLKILSEKVTKRLNKPIVKRQQLPLTLWYTRPNYAKLAKTNYKKVWTEAEMKNIIEYTKKFGH